MSRRLIVSLSVLLCVAAGTAAALGWAWRELNQPLTLAEDGQLIVVERGAGFARVTRDLSEAGILRQPRLLNLYARLEGSATAIHAGEYSLEPGLTPVELLEQLVRGDVKLHQFTIVEGLTFETVLAALRQHPAIRATELTGPDIMAELGKTGVHPEGQFLPETYSFPRGTPDIQVLGWAHEALWSFLDRSWAENIDNTGQLESAYQALILASIIEKETALDSERNQISEVFHERLRRGMRLQTDPTVIYGVGSTFDGNLTRAHLNTDTPYNTYTRRGLPPTPIALASEASIEAALAPVSTGALYFVATGEPDGSHAFSSTLEEHNAAVSRYLQRQRSSR